MGYIIFCILVGDIIGDLVWNEFFVFDILIEVIGLEVFFFIDIIGKKFSFLYFGFNILIRLFI